MYRCALTVPEDVLTKAVHNQSFYCYTSRLALLLLVKIFAQKDTMVVNKEGSSLHITVNVVN
jgi:hypothetical protein